MELTLTLILSDGAANLQAKCNSFHELDSVKDYLTKHGLLGNVSAPAVAAQAEAQTGQQSGEAQAATTEKAGRGRSKKADAANAAAASTGETNALAASAGGAVAGTAPNAPTIQDVTAAITDVSNKFGLREAQFLNQRFGVKKAGELKQEQFAEYVAFARECLAANRKPSEAALPEGAANEDVSSLV